MIKQTMQMTQTIRPLAQRTILSLTLAAGICLGTAAPTASAQTSATAFDDISSLTTGHPQRDTLLRLLKPITIEFEDQPLEAILDFISQYTGAKMRAFYADDAGAQEGLDPEERISVSVTDVSTLELLDMVLQEAVGDFGEIDDNTWQMNRLGVLQVGPKSRLNNYRRTELYDINDLLLEIPDFNNAPQFDIAQASQQGGGQGGGGGGQGPFQNNNQGNNQNEDIIRTIDERAEELIDIIQTTIEEQNWDVIAPNGARLRFYQGNFIMTGADYMHRAVNGYEWWPEDATDFAGIASGSSRLGFFVPEHIQHRLGYDVTPERIVFRAPTTLTPSDITATGGVNGG